MLNYEAFQGGNTVAEKADLERDMTANKAEIHQTLTSMMQGVYITAALIIAGYMLTNRNDAQEIRRVCLLLGVSLTFLVAQGDHKIFRLANWIRTAEKYPNMVQRWEMHKAMLRSRMVVMPICDVGMAAAPLYVVFRLLAAGYASDPIFLGFAVIGLILGIVMIPIGQKLANW